MQYRYATEAYGVVGYVCISTPDSYLGHQGASNWRVAARILRLSTFAPGTGCRHCRPAKTLCRAECRMNVPADGSTGRRTIINLVPCRSRGGGLRPRLGFVHV